MNFFNFKFSQHFLAQSLKSLFYVNWLLGRRFNVLHAVFCSLCLGFFFLNNSLQIHFGTHQNLHHFVRSKFCHFRQPFLHIQQRIPICNIKHQKNTMSATIIRTHHVVKPLLTSSVPNLNLYQSRLLSRVIHRHRLNSVIYAYRRYILTVKRIIRIPN